MKMKPRNRLFFDVALTRDQMDHKCCLTFGDGTIRTQDTNILSFITRKISSFIKPEEIYNFVKVKEKST